jgi:hypothetical protein
VTGSPVNRGSLQEAEAQVPVGDDDGRPRRLPVHARSGAGDADALQLPERRPDRLLAVVHVVGVADRMKAAEGERLRRREWRVETFALDRVPRTGLVEAALEIPEQHVGPPQGVSDARERHLRIGDVHQIDVAGQHQPSSHSSLSVVVIGFSDTMEVRESRPTVSA